MAILASNKPWLWHVSSCFASEYRSWAILLDRVSNTDIAIDTFNIEGTGSYYTCKSHATCNLSISAKTA